MFIELSGEWLGIVLIEKSQLSDVKTVTRKVTAREARVAMVNLMASI